MSTKRKNEGQAAVIKKAPKTSSEIHPFFKNSKHLEETDGSSESDESKIIWGFKGNSDKQPDSLLIGRTRDFSFSGFTSVLALDLDGTIINVKGTHVHAKSADDWCWHNSKVLEKLQQYQKDGAGLVIFTNQGGLGISKKSAKGSDKINEFKTKIQQISFQLKLPFALIASIEKDRYRKPCTGMWEHLEKLCGRSLDRSKSIFVGDAAGRPATLVPKKKKDFSDTDRKLALNIGLNFFTPEEFFLSQTPQAYSLSGFDAKAYLDDLKQKNLLSKPNIQPVNSQELVLMVGLPGSGKTSAFNRFLKPHNYEWINNDTLKTKEKCLKATESFLASKKSVVIDNTNLDAATRKLYIDLAKKFKAPVRCFIFSIDFPLCKHNTLFRSTSLCPSLVNGKPIAPIPDMVFHTFAKKYQQPDAKEGIDSIEKIPFTPLFSSEWSESELSPEQQEKEWTLYYF